MRRVSFATLYGADPTYDSLHRFETSWLLPPTILAGLRGLIALYIFTTIFFIWGWDGTHGDGAAIGTSFSYFTWLTYWGLGFYHLFAAIHTACYARTGRSVLFEKWPRACRVLHGWLYATVTTFPFLVTIVFWVLLFKPPFYKETFPGWSNVCIVSSCVTSALSRGKCARICTFHIPPRTPPCIPRTRPSGLISEGNKEIYQTLTTLSRSPNTASTHSTLYWKLSSPRQLPTRG